MQEVQLSLFKFQIERSCTTRRVKELTGTTIAVLDRLRRTNNLPKYIQSEMGLWIISPAGKSGRYYLWDIAFQPANNAWNAA